MVFFHERHSVSESPQPHTPEYLARMRALEAASWWNAECATYPCLIKLTSLGDHATVLDVGCGSGQTIGWLKGAHKGWNALGLDIATEGLSVARDEGLDVIRASALDIPFASGSVDFITALDVLHHLPLAGGMSPRCERYGAF